MAGTAGLNGEPVKSQEEGPSCAPGSCSLSRSHSWVCRVCSYTFMVLTGTESRFEFRYTCLLEQADRGNDRRGLRAEKDVLKRMLRRIPKL